MKTKYNFFKNTGYALSGVGYLLKETSFLIELSTVVLLSILLCFIPYSEGFKLFVGFSMYTVLIAEAINTAIEKVVDLVTSEFHPLAKQAKDIGSGVVFLCIASSGILWLILLYQAYFS